MKNALPAAFVTISAALFILTGCGRQETQEPVKLPESFTVTAVIQDGELTAAADMTRRPEGWEITMKAPETVEGMTFEITEMESSARFCELNYSFATETMLDSSPILLTSRALDRCVLSENSGTVSGQPYELISTEGRPTELKIGTIDVLLSDLILSEHQGG